MLPGMCVTLAHRCRRGRPPNHPTEPLTTGIANGRYGPRLCENSNDRAPVYKFQSIFGRFPPLQVRRSEKVCFRCAVFRQFPSFTQPGPIADLVCLDGKVGPCAGFRTPAMTSPATRSETGVRKAPRHEIAGE